MMIAGPANRPMSAGSRRTDGGTVTHTRRWLPAGLAAVALLLVTASCGSSSSTTPSSSSGSVSTAPTGTDPCALVTAAEFTAAIPGTTVAEGRRDGRHCRYDFSTPADIAGDLAVTVSFLQGGSNSLIDEAIRMDQGFGLATREVNGLGRRAVYEVSKTNLIVLTDSGSIVEVQVMGRSGESPAALEQQAITIARSALPRA